MTTVSARTELLWNEYVRLSRSGDRRAALRTLTDFIDLMSQETPEVRRAWVLERCVAFAESDSSLLRFPLFRDVVFPVLQERLEQGDADAYYWFGRYSQVVSPGPGIPEEVSAHPIFLFWRAIELEPSHTPARRALIAALTEAFTASTHEMPSGVLGLLSNNGATSGECDELLCWLERFESLVLAEGVSDQHARQIEFWRQCVVSYRGRLRA